MSTQALIQKLADALERSNTRLRTFGIRDNSQTMRLITRWN